MASFTHVLQLIKSEIDLMNDANLNIDRCHHDLVGCLTFSLSEIRIIIDSASFVLCWMDLGSFTGET